MCSVDVISLIIVIVVTMINPNPKAFTDKNRILCGRVTGGEHFAVYSST